MSIHNAVELPTLETGLNIVPTLVPRSEKLPDNLISLENYKAKELTPLCNEGFSPIYTFPTDPALFVDDWPICFYGLGGDCPFYELPEKAHPDYPGLGSCRK